MKDAKQVNEEDSSFKESLEKSKKIVQNNKMRVINKAKN